MSEKKDLTNIFDLPKEAAPETGESSPTDFPVTRPPSLESLGELDTPLAPDFSLPPPSDEAVMAATAPDEPSSNAEDPFAVTEPSAGGSDFSMGLGIDTSSDPATDTSHELPFSSDKTPDPAPAPEAMPGLDPAPASEPVTFESLDDAIADPLPEPAPPPPPSVSAISAGLEAVKKYSESMAPAPAEVAAGVPYTLLIEGKLKPHERDRFIELVTRGGFGIREVELEPQLEAGRILIPRISEYAGVTLVQALRGAHVKIRLGPADQIFTSREGYDGDTTLLPRDRTPDFVEADALLHAAERMPVTSESSLPNGQEFDFIDSLHLSVNLKPDQVAGAGNDVFEATLETLKRSLKFRAHHKGANAIVRFSWQLIPVSAHQSYKLVVQGTAVRTLA